MDQQATRKMLWDLMVEVLSSTDVEKRTILKEATLATYNKNLYYLDRLGLRSAHARSLAWRDEIGGFVRAEIHRRKPELDEILFRTDTNMYTATFQILYELIIKYEKDSFKERFYQRCNQKKLSEPEKTEDAVIDIELDGKVPEEERSQYLKDAINYTLGLTKDVKHTKSEVVKFLADLRDGFYEPTGEPTVDDIIKGMFGFQFMLYRTLLAGLKDKL